MGSSKPKPRWNLHLWNDENWLMESLKLFRLYPEDGPAPLLDPFPNAYFTLALV